MSEHILFLTGRLASRNLERVLQRMQPTPFSYEIRDIGIQVAALMSAKLIHKRVTDVGGAQRVLVPGHCRGDLEALSAALGTPVERGPEDLKDLPEYFGRGGVKPDLSGYDLRIFAEIVDAPVMTVDQILDQAAAYSADGADVIDVGCLPDTPFPHLEEAVQALAAAGHTTSVDSLEVDELRRGGAAGADYLLSLTERTVDIADEVAATPILIPDTAGDLESLGRAIAAMEARGRPFIADPVLDPIHFGFTDSVVRYHELRRRHPDVEIMMGTGNVTELTDADTTGMNALLAGLCSELRITNLLTVQVSDHCRTVVREADLARRITYAARAAHDLPRGYSRDLMVVHERRPFTDSLEEIRELAAQVRDPNFRIQVTEDGIHVYNRDGMHHHTEPFAFFPSLAVDDDGAHAFYLGVELARAQIAWQLGKRYVQDEELKWGCLVDRTEEDKSDFTQPGPTLQARRQHRRGQG